MLAKIQQGFIGCLRLPTILRWRSYVCPRTSKASRSVVQLHCLGAVPNGCCRTQDAIRGFGSGTGRRMASDSAQFTEMYLRTVDPESRTQNVVAGLSNRTPIPGS